MENGVPIIYRGDYRSYLGNQRSEPSTNHVSLPDERQSENSQTKRSDEKQQQRKLENKSRKLDKRIKTIESELETKDCPE